MYMYVCIVLVCVYMYPVKILKISYNSKNWNDVKFINFLSNLSNGWEVLHERISYTNSIIVKLHTCIHVHCTCMYNVHVYINVHIHI